MVKDLKEILKYASKRKIFLYFGVIFAIIHTIFSLIPFIYIWKIIKEAVELNGNYNIPNDMVHNSYIALVFSIAAIITYFLVLMCNHLVAFRVASQIRLTCIKHTLDIQIGNIINEGSGKLRKKIPRFDGRDERCSSRICSWYASCKNI